VLEVSPAYFFEGLDDHEQDAGTLPEDRKEWLKLAATAGGIQNATIRAALKTMILAASRIEREVS
jgi:hypothetical protein